MNKLATEIATNFINMGYRVISRRHRIIARIDRPDWIYIMAKDLLRAPADFYVPGETAPDSNWCDHYRRCYSKHKAKVSEDVLQFIPGSGGDSVGYVPPPEAAAVIKPPFPGPPFDVYTAVAVAAGVDREVAKRVILAYLHSGISL